MMGEPLIERVASVVETNPAPKRSWASRVKTAVLFGLYYSGIEWLLARLLRVDAVAVLMYHGVCDGSAIPPSIDFHVSRRGFERQMRALKRRYPVIRLDDLASALGSGKRLRKAVVLTFDDGYRNNATYAAPVLQRFGLPYTIFVATEYLETGTWIPLNEVYRSWAAGELKLDQVENIRKLLRGRPRNDSRELIQQLRGRARTLTPAVSDSFAMLTWDEAAGLSHAGADFGSHTHTHCNMAVEPPEQQRSELLVSRELIERRLGRPVRSFAYPYGRAEHISETARAAVISAGFECAVSAEYGLVTNRSDRYYLHRLGYDERMWRFAGEILYQFIRQAARDAWSHWTRKRDRQPVAFLSHER